MRLTIVVPIYISTELHLDFTRQTLASIRTTHDYEILIINNFCAPEFTPGVNQLAAQKPPGVKIIPNPQGNILASAWNLGINYSLSRSCAYTLILNNDIILHPKAIDNLVTFATKHPEFILWSASEWANSRTLATAKMTQSYSEHPHFSCFMISPKTIESVGLFDEHFTMGYFEDNDYHTRLLQKGFKAAATDSAKFYHYGSRTVHADDNLKPESKFHYQKNRAYFKKKWGLDIHGRAFSPPESILAEIKPIAIKPTIH